MFAALDRPPRVARGETQRGETADGAEFGRFWSDAEHSKFLEGLEIYGCHDAHAISA